MDTRCMGPGPPGALLVLRMVVTLVSPIGGGVVNSLIRMAIIGAECADESLVGSLEEW